MNLLNLILAPVIIIYVILMSILFLFIFNLSYLAVLGWRNRKIDTDHGTMEWPITSRNDPTADL